MIRSRIPARLQKASRYARGFRGLTLLEISIALFVFAILMSVIFSFLSQGTDSLKTVALTMDLRRKANQVLKGVEMAMTESRRDFLMTADMPDSEQAPTYQGRKAFQCVVCASPRDAEGRYVIEGHVSQFQAAVIYAPRPRLENGKTVWDLIRYQVTANPNAWGSSNIVNTIEAIDPASPNLAAEIQLSNNLNIERRFGEVVLSDIRHFQVSDPALSGPITIHLGVQEDHGRVLSREEFQISVTPGQ